MITDEQITQLFFERSELGLKELDKRYGELCRKISYNILNNRADAEECVNDTYLGVWNTIPPTKPNPLLTYVCKIVRNISLKRYNYNIAKKRNSVYDVAISELEAYLSSPNTIENELETAELARIIENFLDTLTMENRVIFLRRYWFFDSYKDIAGRVGLSEKNISVRLSRIRGQMKQYLIEREVLI